MRITVSKSKVFDAGVAIDDVGFIQCAPDYPEDNCPDGFFHCTQTRYDFK